MSKVAISIDEFLSVLSSLFSGIFIFQTTVCLSANLRFLFLLLTYSALARITSFNYGELPDSLFLPFFWKEGIPARTDGQCQTYLLAKKCTGSTFLQWPSQYSQKKQHSHESTTAPMNQSAEQRKVKSSWGLQTHFSGGRVIGSGLP